MRTQLRTAGLFLAALVITATARARADGDEAAPHLAAADACELREDRAGALAAIESALRLEGKVGVEALRRRAAWRLRDGDLDGALADLERAIERGPKDPTLRLQRAVVSGQLAAGEGRAWVQGDEGGDEGMEGEALDDLREAARLQPDLPETLYLEAERRRQAGQAGEGDDLLTKAVNLLEPDDGRLVPMRWSEAGHARDRGDLEAEAAALERALALWPAWAALPARLRLCLGLPAPPALRRELEAQSAEVAPLLPLAADHPRRRARRGMLFVRAGRYAEAQPELEASLAADPDQCEAGVVLAWLVERRSPARARQLLDHAVEIAPDDARRAAALAARSALKQRAGDVPGALADLDLAVEARPGESETRFARGRMRTELGLFDGAEEDLTAVLAVAPGHAWAWYYRGQCRARRYAFEEGLADLDRALELSPRTAWLWIGRAGVRSQCGLTQAAATDSARAIDLAPEQVEAWLVRVEVLRALGDTSGALAAATKALGLDDTRADTWVARGQLRAAAGDAAGAREDAAAAVKRAPGEAAGCMSRARVLEALDDLDGVARDYRRVLELAPGSGLLVPLAMVEVARGKTDAARELVRRAAGDPYGALVGAVIGEPLDRATLGPLVAAGRWPGPVAAHVLGQLDEAGLLDAAEDLKNGAGLATQRCEAHTYLGLEAERAGRLDDARAHYAAAVDTSASQVLELGLSRRRLAALRGK